METTTRKRNKKSTSGSSEERIRAAYISHLLEHGQRPPSVFKFCQDLGMTEDAFYNHFGSFDGLERNIWKNFIESTLKRLQGDESFATFSAREKVLAFYYTFFEDLKSHRSFVLLQLDRHRKPELVPGFLKDLKTVFESFVEGVLQAGKDNGEIATRPYLDKQYPHLFWIHMGFLLLFWKEDNSPAFETTDAAVEKSVNLAFDLISKGAVDAAVDFAKFMYQTKIK